MGLGEHILPVSSVLEGGCGNEVREVKGKAQGQGTGEEDSGRTPEGEGREMGGRASRPGLVRDGPGTGGMEREGSGKEWRELRGVRGREGWATFESPNTQILKTTVPGASRSKVAVHG